MDTNSDLKNMLLSVPETAEAPSDEVWKGVRRGLKRRDFWRVKGKVLLSAVLLAAACGAVLLFVPQKNNSEVKEWRAESVAEVTEERALPAEIPATAMQAEAAVKTEASADRQVAEHAIPAARPAEARAEAVGTHPETQLQSVPVKAETAVAARPEEKTPAVARQQVAAAAPVVKAEMRPAETETVRPEAAETPAFQAIFPSAFTPNGDGLNDTYGPLLSERTTQYLMRIYNRSNQLVFQTVHPEEAWDGTFRGQPQPHGAYVCIISCTTASGKHSAKSEFLLLRD